MSTPESRGVTRTQLRGTASLVFTNATSETMCGLRIQRDGTKAYGDNWLPAGGLASGKSIDLKVTPGTYMATWNTCRTGGKPYFAATLTSETAFTIKDDRDSKQLFAYVASTEAPTKYAGPRAYHAMVKFQGQAIDFAPVRVTPRMPRTIAAIERSEPVESPQVASRQVAPPKQVDLSEFIDRKAKRSSKTVMKASLARKHDLADQRVGYTERKR